jgi:hypothetical protein
MGGSVMNTATENATRTRSVIMKLPGGPFTYRHARVGASVECAAGLWCVVGVLLVRDGYWRGVLPIVVGALPFWGAYHLLQANRP